MKKKKQESKGMLAIDEEKKNGEKTEAHGLTKALLESLYVLFITVQYGGLSKGSKLIHVQ